MSKSAFCRVAAIAGLVLAVGCNDVAPPSKSSKPAGSAKSGTPSASAGTPTVSPQVPVVALNEADKTAARAAADDFLTDLLAAATTKKDPAKAYAMTTVELRKRRSGTLFSDSEKKAGYSESDVERWLTKQAGDARGTGVRTVVFAPAGTGASVRGDLTGAAGKRAYALRLTRADGKWLVADFQTAPVTVTAVPEGGTPELLWAREFALDFLEAVAAGDTNEAASLMTPALRKQLAPPSTPSDEKLGYDDFKLGNVLKERAGTVEGFTLTGQNASGDAVTLAGSFTRKGGVTPFTLAMAADKAAGTWQVSDFGTGK